MLAKRIAPVCCGLICSAVASVDGAPIVSVNRPLVAGLLPPLVTVMVALPMPATSPALSCATIRVVEMRVVVRGLPLNCSVDDASKPVPVTLCMYAGPPAVTKAGAREDTDSGASATRSVMVLEVMEPPSVL